VTETLCARAAAFPPNNRHATPVYETDADTLLAVIKETPKLA
jgi:hypothetical protein